MAYARRRGEAGAGGASASGRHVVCGAAAAVGAACSRGPPPPLALPGERTAMDRAVGPSRFVPTVGHVQSMPKTARAIQ